MLCLKYPNVDNFMAKKEVILNGIVVGEVEATGNIERDLQAIRALLKEKGLHKEVSENDAMYGQANSFAETANNIYGKDLKHSPYKGSSSAPFVVNATFSIEIYLKTIHHAYGHKVRGHNLENIFKSLPKEAKKIVTDSAIDVRPRYILETGVNIESSLQSLSKSFEQWRYLYEHNKLTIEIQSIRYAMHVLHEACCRVRELKKKHNNPINQTGP